MNAPTGFMPFAHGERVRHTLTGKVGFVAGDPSMTIYGSKVDVRNAETGDVWPSFVDELVRDDGIRSDA